MKKIRIYVELVVVAILGVLTFGWFSRREGKAEGAENERAKTDRDRVQKADEAGDDEGVLDEWRKHR